MSGKLNGKDIFTMKASRLERITISEDQCGARPCIRGLRVRVSDILSLLANGASIDEILDDYPYLEREDILACLEYATQTAD